MFIFNNQLKYCVTDGKMMDNFYEMHAYIASLDIGVGTRGAMAPTDYTTSP